MNALSELASTILEIKRIISSYERFAGPRADGLVLPVEVKDRVMRFRECVAVVQYGACSSSFRSALEKIREEWEETASKGALKQYLSADNISSNILDLNRKISGAMSILQVGSSQTPSFLRTHHGWTA
jgi:hypothetical protein